MSLTPAQKLLFSLNATVLITHQIDAAFWHEWEMFHLPGGSQFNLLLNLPIVALVLYAQGQVVSNATNARAFYILIAGLGLLTFSIHAAFFLAGAEEFTQAMSIALLLAMATLSVLQLLSLRSR